MKTLIIIFITILPFLSFSQDTIFLKTKQPVLCKVVEIGIDEIKYKTWDNLEGPTIVVLKTNVYKISYINGKSELIVPDELDINKEAEIIDKRSAIKFGFFSLINYHFSVCYEKVLSVGKNFEAKIAYVGIGANPSEKNTSGFYTKVGMKFLLGNDYYVKGMKYIHPLKGRYIKPEFTYSFVYDQNLQYYNYSYGYTNYSTYYDLNSSALALSLVYGRQFILDNTITLDYSVGLGYGVLITSTTKSIPRDSNYLNRANYYSHLYFSRDFPLVISFGLNIGFVLK